MRADPVARPALHQHAMAVSRQLKHAFRRQTHAIFVILDLFDGSYDHGDPFVLAGKIAAPPGIVNQR